MEEKNLAQHDFVMIYGTCPDEAVARQIGGSLVRLNLVACVNILPGMQSIYRWEGKVEEAQEVVFIAKAKKEHWPEISRRFARLHPYDEPALVVLDIKDGLPGYLDWIAQSSAAS
ncbi:MAG: divalent-cation tolerance protein CutA [Cohaesibacter sp.]|jgi:periplasmic divalent cation tolerance protein|nr:divalent-cation tolerance protein CutA [Cohaesibacter sp.]